MKLLHVLLLVGVLGPHSAVYVKGHSKAAQKARENLQAYTCYCSSESPDDAVATLEVGHIANRKKEGRSWLVMFLANEKHQIVWEAKAEEYPWPFPTAMDRLLRNLTKSTCPADQYAEARGSRPRRSHDPFACSQLTRNAVNRQH